MKTYAIELLNQLMDLSQKHPEKWETTCLRFSFRFKDKPSITISKFLNDEDQETIKISSIDRIGHVMFIVSMIEKDDPELYQAYLALYEQVKDLAIGNNYRGIKAAALACA